MIKDIISEEEKAELIKNGYKLENRNNVLTIRNCTGKVAVEIMFYAEDEILINTRDNFYWGKKVTAIISAHGESLFVYYIDKDGNEEIIVD